MVGYCKKLGRFMAVLVPVFACALVLGLGEYASATVTLPSTGVVVEDYIEAAILAVGATAAVAIGGFCAYMVLKRAIQWIRTALT